MASFSQFYPWVTIECPSVPPKLVDDALVRAAIEFCRETNAIEEDVSVALSVGASSYVLPVAATSDVLAVQRGVIGTSYLIGVTVPAMRAFTDTVSNFAPQQPFAFSVDHATGTINVFPTPDTSYTLSVTASVAPKVGVTSLDDLFFTKYREAIVHYALFLLMAQTTQPWYNPDMAAVHHKGFSREVANARIALDYSKVRAEQSVTMRPFA